MSACTLMAESRSRSMNINVSTFDVVKGQWLVVLSPHTKLRPWQSALCQRRGILYSCARQVPVPDVFCILNVSICPVMEVKCSVVVQRLGIVGDFYQLVSVIGDSQVINRAERAVVPHAKHDMIDASTTFLPYLSGHIIYCNIA